MMRVVGALMALVVALAVAVGAPPAAAHAATSAGRVSVTVVTPKGVPAAVVLRAATRIVLAKSPTGSLRRLSAKARPGNYRVSVPAVSVNGVRYLGAPSLRTVRVRAGRTVSFRVRLSAEPGARRFAASNVGRTRVDLRWSAPKGARFVLRRSTGTLPPKGRTSGRGIQVRSATAIDRGLTASTTYSYALFTRIGSRWYGPQTLRVRTAAASGAPRAAYVARPTTVFAATPSITKVVGSGAHVVVSLRSGTATPVIGAAVVLPPSAGLAGGYIGVVKGVSSSGAVTLAPGGLGDALERYSLSVPSFTSDPAALPLSDVKTAVASVVARGPAGAERSGVVTASRTSPQPAVAPAIAPASAVRTAAAGSPSRLSCDSGEGDVNVGIDRSLGIGGSFALEGDMARQRATVDMRVVIGGKAALSASVTRKATCSLRLPQIAKTVVVGGIPIGFALSPVVKATISGRATFTGVGATLQAGFAVHGTMAVQGGRIAMTADSRPITSFARTTPSVAARVDVGMRVGGDLLVGPGVASTVGGALAGIQGSLNVVDGTFSLAAAADASGAPACLRLSAGMSAGLYLVAQAWLHVPFLGFDLTARLKLAALDSPIPYFTPLSVPAGCDPDGSSASPPPSGGALPGNRWTSIGGAHLSPGSDGSFTLGFDGTFWGGAFASLPSNQCDYTFTAQARIVSGAGGYGLGVRASVVDESPHADSIQYDVGAGGYRDAHLPDGSETGDVVEASLDDEWHTVSVVADGAQYTSMVDGRRIFTGRTTASCGEGLFIRVWNGTTAEFRNVSVTTGTPPAGTEPAGWTIGFDSIGPVTTSMTAAQMVAALHSNASTAVSNPQCMVYGLGSGGTSVQQQIVSRLWGLASSNGASGPVDALSFGSAYGGAAGVPEALKPSLPQTEKGITLGSTLARLQSAYPSATVGPARYRPEEKTAEVTGPNGTAMRFDIDSSGVITNITIGRLPQVDYVDACG